MRARKFWTTLPALLCVLAVGASAQDKAQKKPGAGANVVVERDTVVVGPHGPMPGVPMGQRGPGGDTFVFVSSEMSFDGKVVKGAPYSAEAVTETTHALADGNRIVRKNSAQVYRDGEGRTRRDQAIGVIGPFAAAGDPPQTVFINDPVSNINYILDPRTRTARKANVQFSFLREPKPEGLKAEGAKAEAMAKAEAEAKAAAGSGQRFRTKSQGYVFTTPGGPHPGEFGPHPNVMVFSGEGQEPKTESLGEQTVEGVRAEGKRTTLSIPAGAIGNERAIDIVTERWYSPELQTVVMTKHSDPRFGETVYRLTNINRTEPARSLFEVPSDYTLKEGPTVYGRNNFKIRKGEPKEEFRFQYHVKPDQE